MSELITRTARLVPYSKRPRQAPGFVTAYTNEPMPSEAEFKHGSLFIVIEVISSGRMAEEVANLIIDSMKDPYYRSDSTNVTQSSLVRFEEAIKSVNHILRDFIDSGNAAWVGKLSAVITTVSNDEIHLAQTGSAEAFLCRKKSNTRITSGDGSKNTQPNKTFGSITSGTVQAGDRILLATPALIHILPLTKLQGILESSTPNVAIAEIQGLMNGTMSVRVAAVIVEITTPELAALQIDLATSDDIVLNKNENALDLALVASVPLANSAVSSGKKIAIQAKELLVKVKPHISKLALNIIKIIRKFLNKKNRPKKTLIVGLSIVLLLIFYLSFNNNGGLEKAKKRFNNDLANEQAASQLLGTGNSSQALPLLKSVNEDLISLSLSEYHKSLDAQVSPNSINSLHAAVIKLLNQAKGISSVQSNTVATISRSSEKITHMEISDNKAILISDSGKYIYKVDLNNGDVFESNAKNTSMGRVVATALSDTGGIFILTSTPELWLYNPSKDSLLKEQFAANSPPNGSVSISSFNGNVYFLNTDVQKTPSTSNGFGFPVTSIRLSANPMISGSKALAVDGGIYLANKSALLRYEAGILKQSLKLPDYLTSISSIHSLNNGDLLLCIDKDTNLIAKVSFDQSSLKIKTKYSIMGVLTIYDAGINKSANTYFALINGNKLIKFTSQ